MIRGFKDAGTEDVFNGPDTRAARQACPESLWGVARRKLDQLVSAEALADLRIPPGKKLKKLEGRRIGQHSIRINDQYRVCFVWTDESPADVGITDYR